MDAIIKDGEAVGEIYESAQLALQSIADILPEIDDAAIKEELLREHEEYERICSEAASLAHSLGASLKEPSPIKKAMLWSAIKISAVADNSARKVAETMVKGTVQGITKLKSAKTDGAKTLNAEVCNLLRDSITLFEGFEKKWKSFL